MCIAYPMKIEKIEGQMAQVSVGDIKARVSLALIEHPKKGDYVLIHAGVAIEKINQARAEEILTLITQLGRKMDEETAGSKSEVRNRKFEKN